MKQITALFLGVWLLAALPVSARAEELPPCALTILRETENAPCPGGARLFWKSRGKSTRGSLFNVASLSSYRSVPRTLRPWTPIFYGDRAERNAAGSSEDEGAGGVSDL